MGTALATRLEMTTPIQTMDQFLASYAEEWRNEATARSAAKSVLVSAAKLVMGNAIAMPLGFVYAGASIYKPVLTAEEMKKKFEHCLYGMFDSSATQSPEMARARNRLREVVRSLFDRLPVEEKKRILMHAINHQDAYVREIRDIIQKACA